MKKNIKTTNLFLENPLVKNNPEEPFKNDYSGKLQNFAENLTHFIEKKASNKPYVFSLSTPWGLGKTAFIDMWGQWLINNGRLVIKYDAWHEDYSEDPLLSLIAAINEQLPLAIKKNKQKRELLESIKSSGIKLGINFAPILVKFLINVGAEYFGVREAIEQAKEKLPKSKALGKAIDDMEEKIEDNIEEKLVDFIGRTIESHQYKNKTVIHFKASIKKLLDSENSKVLFFFVDELDRCKPLFAFSLLEVIKHFFDIEKVCFILVNNQEALYHVFQKVYGQQFKSKEYLDRFIDRSVSLPSVDKAQFVNYQIEQQETLKALKGQSSFTLKIIKNCCKIFSFDLRQVQKYLHDIIDFIDMNESKSKQIKNDFYPAICYLLALNRYDSTLFYDYIDTESEHALQKINLYPYTNLDEKETLILKYGISFLLASKDDKKLSIKVHELVSRIKNMESKRSGLSPEEIVIRDVLYNLRSKFVKEIFGDFRKHDPFSFTQNNTDYRYIANYNNYLELAINIITFLKEPNENSNI